MTAQQLPDPGSGHWVRVRSEPPRPPRDATRAGWVALAASAAPALYVVVTALLGHPPWRPGDGPDLTGELIVVPAWLAGGYWLALVNRNAERRRALPQHSAPFAWIAWVIPLVCFFLPKKLVDDAWAGTAGVGLRAVRRQTRPWWALWLLFLFVGAPLAHDWDWAFTGLVGEPTDVAWHLRATSVVLTVAAFAAWTQLVRRLSAVQGGARPGAVADPGSSAPLTR